MSRTTARGYGQAHQRERQRLIPIVRDEGARCHAVVCLMPDRWMPPGTGPRQWDLGHTVDRTTWTGPEHVRCNRSEGATRGNKTRQPPSAPRPHRRWVI